jgi:hypothetical protein
LELELGCSPEGAKGRTYFRQGTVELHIRVNILPVRTTGLYLKTIFQVTSMM